MSKKIRCTLCNGTGKRIDDDPCLDFGGPLNYEIPCECQLSDEPFTCVPTPPDPVAVLRGKNKKLLAEVKRLRAEVKRLRAEVKRLKEG